MSELQERALAYSKIALEIALDPYKAPEVVRQNCEIALETVKEALNTIGEDLEEEDG